MAETPSSSLSLKEDIDLSFGGPRSSICTHLPPSVIRLWRPAAQRNLRNLWSKLASYRQEWTSSSSSGLSHAKALVNSYLSQRYMPSMELGVLSDMPEIRKKVCIKLLKQQELNQCKLLSSYKNMVDIISQMVNASRLMRFYFRGTSSSAIIQFSSFPEDENDRGDGGGIPPFTFLAISFFEKLAEELVQMFSSELNLKRLLVLEFLSISSEHPSVNGMHWLDELYTGEFDNLSLCNLYSKETQELHIPRLNGLKSDMPVPNCHHQPSHEVLQIYLTTWLAEVNIDTHRVDEIFSVVGEEMHVSFS